MNSAKVLFQFIRVLAGVVLLAGGSSAQKRLNTAAVDSYLKPYVISGNFAGQVLVREGRRVVFEKAYGYADREKNLRDRSVTRFHVASVSMQFTAAAILRLVDQGALSLDTPVSEVVPWVTGGEKIRMRDLLLQRSGLADINDLPNYSEVLEHHQTPATLVAKIRERPLLFEPGSKFLHEEHSAYNCSH